MKNEHSKILTFFSILQNIVVIIMTLYCAIIGIDTSIFMYLIPASFGLTGITFTFYFNKAKLENSIKLKYEYARKIIILKKKTGMYSRDELASELDTKVDEAEMLIDNELNENIDRADDDQEWSGN